MSEDVLIRQDGVVRGAGETDRESCDSEIHLSASQAFPMASSLAVHALERVNVGFFKPGGTQSGALAGIL